ncbi:hypothetical protein LR48_Vigan02g110100 [Vigna angularis]|uniref:U1-C C2H2-type zinc finger domain-containing protein n=1 Tax=Phaseolus angularis TaxID=3914 RepID=A0A0L9TWT9_PHAAN|nr:hypothetical protein LR48_Vigan02g110100 [Vigna angularis]
MVDANIRSGEPSVRKQHNAGYKHKANVRTYYQQFEEQQTQSLIDQRIKEHLGQAAAFQQVGVAYNHLMVQRPNLPPVLPPPRLPIPGNAQVPGGQPLMPGMRPPVFPRPLPGAPGYVSAPTMPPMLPPPGAPQVSGQLNTLPRPPSLAPPPTVPGSTAAPASNGAPSMVSSALYQANPPAPSSGVLSVECYLYWNLKTRAICALPTRRSSNEDLPFVVICRLIIGLEENPLFQIVFLALNFLKALPVNQQQKSYFTMIEKAMKSHNVRKTNVREEGKDLPVLIHEPNVLLEFFDAERPSTREGGENLSFRNEGKRGACRGWRVFQKFSDLLSTLPAHVRTLPAHFRTHQRTPLRLSRPQLTVDQCTVATRSPLSPTHVQLADTLFPTTGRPLCGRHVYSTTPDVRSQPGIRRSTDAADSPGRAAAGVRQWMSGTVVGHVHC